MHPMFVKLFIATDTDDLLAEEEAKRRDPRRSRRKSTGHGRTGRRPRSQWPSATVMDKRPAASRLPG